MKKNFRIPVPSNERHRINRVGWLRAAVLGANDGLLSTGSLVLGVASAHLDHKSIVLTAAAGLVAGAMSMAAGEYVSVHSQADTETAELALERTELKTDDAGEHKELAAIYVNRGLDPNLAKQVAQQLMAHDALGAHAKDELGITDTLGARPIQAALTSAVSFAVGAAHAFASVAFRLLIELDSDGFPNLFALSGAVRRSCRAGWRRNICIGAARVTLWGVIAMAVTAGCGKTLRTRQFKSSAESPTHAQRVGNRRALTSSEVIFMHEEHRQAAEQHERAAQAHRTAAEHNEKGENDASKWHAERALEYSDHAFKLAKEAHNKSGRIEAL